MQGKPTVIRQKVHKVRIGVERQEQVWISKQFSNFKTRQTGTESYETKN